MELGFGFLFNEITFFFQNLFGYDSWFCFDSVCSLGEPPKKSISSIQGSPSADAWAGNVFTTPFSSLFLIRPESSFTVRRLLTSSQERRRRYAREGKEIKECFPFHFGLLECLHFGHIRRKCNPPVKYVHLAMTYIYYHLYCLQMVCCTICLLHLLRRTGDIIPSYYHVQTLMRRDVSRVAREMIHGRLSKGEGVQAGCARKPNHSKSIWNICTSPSEYCVR